MKRNSLLKRIASEPYRIFFPLAVLFGLGGVGHWFAYAVGWLPRYTGFVHASLQMQSYMCAFIFGFLMTAVPRFSGTDHATPREVAFVLGIFSLAQFFIYTQKWIWAQLSFLTLLLTLFFFIFFRFRLKQDIKKSAIKPPLEFVWISVALTHGIVGAALFMLGALKFTPAWCVLAGKAMMEQGFVLSIVIGVGGFLAPRLMGTFRSETTGTGPSCQIKQTKKRKQSVQLHLLGGLLLFSSFILEGFGFLRVAYGLRASLVTTFLIMARSLVRSPFVSEQFAKYLWLSFWMVALGSWMAFLAPRYKVPMLHFVFIGGYSLMTFSVATMVIMTHAGEAARLRTPSKVLAVVSTCVLLALSLRIGSAFSSDQYFSFIGAASAIWVVAGIIWLVYILPFVFRFPKGNVREASHQEAKDRVMEVMKREQAR
jgi:uncharacterized protein involved in response to NO